jgi:hypothetical protein
MNFIKTYKDVFEKDFSDNVKNYYKYCGFEEESSRKKYNSNAFITEFYISGKEDAVWGEIEKEIIEKMYPIIKDYLSFNPECSVDSYYFRHAAFLRQKEFFQVPAHCDDEVDFISEEEFIRNFTIVIYLNNNFEGGELLFPLQGVSVKPEPGLVVVFPASFMYPHLTNPTIGADRYALRLSYYYKKDIILKPIKKDLE